MELIKFKISSESQLQIRFISFIKTRARKRDIYQIPQTTAAYINRLAVKRLLKSRLGIFPNVQEKNDLRVLSNVTIVSAFHSIKTGKR